MWDVLLLFSSICTAVVVGDPETVIGHRGERVDIRCSYKSGYETNSKFFCKGECIFGIRNIMVKSGSPAKDERFSLTDDTTARVFTVTITDLRTADEGPYWCAVERTLSTDMSITDVYSEIYLLVKKEKKTTEVSTISSSSKTLSSFSTTELNPQSVTHQTETETTTRTTTGNTTDVLSQPNNTLFQQSVHQNTETDCMYEEIPNTDAAAVTSSSNQTPASSSNQMPVSSSNQTPASHLNTRPKVSIVYATVTNQQPDSNPGNTHLTNPVTDTDCDYYANIKSPEATQDSRTELIYTTATHPQNTTTDEGPIYSVINHK